MENNSNCSNVNPSVILENCPISKQNTLIASVTGLGNSASESYLRIHKYDVQSYDQPLKILAHVKTSINFTSVSWTKFGENSEDTKYGFIIGGHQDGTLSLWDVTLIINNKENIPKSNFGLVFSKKLQSGAVNSIKFNQRPNLFAAGAKEIILVSINIDRNEKFLKIELECPPQDNGVISSISWNEQVPYILAAGTTVGNVYIWDMKKNSLHMSICDPNLSNDDDLRVNASIPTYVMWMSDGFSFLMSYDHPDYQFMTQYDVRQANAPSGDFHGGHSKSIICMAKNSHDDNYVISLGKDYVVTCWSYYNNKPITQMHDKSASLQASQVIWLNKVPDSFLAAGLDGNIYTHQVNFTQNENNHNNNAETKELPPKWFTKKCGLNFGFGGKLLTFSEKTSPIVNLHKIQNSQNLSGKIKSFIEKAEKDNLNELLAEKIQNTTEKSINLMWTTLKCVYNHDFNPLFTALGYDKESITAETYNYIGKKVAKSNTSKTRDFSNLSSQNKLQQQGKADAMSFFTEMTNKAEKEPAVASTNLKSSSAVVNNTEKPNLITETISKNINWNQGAEKLIKQSLVTGDFESAVDVALKCGRDAEALLIADSSGNEELFTKTKNEYFSKNKDLFVRNIFSSIINKNFEALLDYNVIKEWKEYILYAKTYLNEAKFSSFAYSIAEKLINAEDIYSAVVCFILGQNFPKCIELLYNRYLKESENVSKLEKNFLLHNLFEEVIALEYILDRQKTPNEYFDNIMNEYSNLLIDNNLFVEACRYINKIRNKSQKIITIYDRIYGHCESTIGKMFPKLPLPYNVINVKPKLHAPKVQITQKNPPQTQIGKQNQNLWEAENKNPFNSSAPPKNVSGQTGFSYPNSNLNANNIGNIVNNTNQLNTGNNFNNQNPLRNTLKTNPPPVSNKNTSREDNRTSQPHNEPYHTQDNNIQHPPLTQTTIKTSITRPVNPPISKIPMPILNKTQNNEEEKINYNTGVNPPPIRNPSDRNFGNNPPRVNVPVAVPRMNQIPNINPPVAQHNKIQSPYNSQTPKSSYTPVVQQTQNAPLSENEELILNAFERYRELYNSIYPDENKQKDFNNKIIALSNKLKNHDLKANLLNILVDFINAFDNNAAINDLKKLSTKIQSNGWDQNKTWMPCIEKLITLPRK